MPSPFPGMDPYLEDPVLWPGVHHHLISALANALNTALPPNYVADVGERLYVVTPPRSIFPDVSVLRRVAPARVEADRGGAAVADGAPWVVSAQPEEVREPFIEIIALAANRSVVTGIEVLSPANKRAGSEGRDLYLAKQRQFLHSASNLVEFDLLRAGEHTIAAPRSHLEARGQWDYLGCVHRPATRWQFEVWPMRLRESLPVIHIPLSAGDADVPIDLQAALAEVYERGAYARLLDYNAPLTEPLTSEDAAWADTLLATGGHKS